MTPHALLFTLAAVGVSETAYLIREKFSGRRPVCVVGSSCHQVLESRYNRIAGVPNEIAGFLFYVVVLFLTAFLVIGIEPRAFWVKGLQGLMVVGVLLSGYFTYLQWRVLKAWCFWCLMSAATIFLMAFIAFTAELTPSFL